MKSKEFLDTLSKIGNDPEFENEIKNDRIREKKKKRIATVSAAGVIAFVLAAVLLITSIPLVRNGRSGKTSEAKITFPDAEPIIFNGGAYRCSDPSLPAELEKVSITADGKSSGVISVDSSFIVETSGDTDAETLAQYLTVTPAVATSVTKLSSKSFKVTPASGTLAPGQIYKFTIGDPENPSASYAFQTESKLAVSSMFPGDRTFNVPVNTGIEVTFSETVVLDANTPPFTVSPSVKGTYSVYPDGKTVLFLPSSNLKYDTVYTVTVDGGVKGTSGKTFEGKKTAVFKTYSKKYESSRGSSHSEYLFIGDAREKEYLFSPGESAKIGFHVYTNLDKTPNAACDLYAFKSAQQAASVLADYEKKPADSGTSAFDFSKLKKIGTFSAKSEDGRYSSFFSVNFGKKLAPGTYVAKITASISKGFGKSLTDAITVIIQVTDLRVYTVSSDGRTYVWVNSRDGGPVEDADVTASLLNRFDGFYSEEAGESVKAKTDRSGIASFDSTECDSAIILVEKDGKTAVVCATVQPEDTCDYYMHYMYTDRNVYFSDDTVNFSGYIRHSFGESVPERLYLMTGLSSLKTPVEVDENGFFSGSISFSNCSSGFYALVLYDENEQFIAGQYFVITEDQKPQYTAKITFDKLFYRRGETITATVTATFFDGTPAEGLEFECWMRYFNPDNEIVKTDSNGEAKITFTPRNSDVYNSKGTDPLRFKCQAELTNFEAQRLGISKTVLCFHSDYIVDKGSNERESYISLNKRDTSNLKKEDDLSREVFPENTVGEPLSSETVSYILVKCVIEKTEETRYDSYKKRNVKYYSYKTVEKVADSGTKQFSNGIVEFPLLEVSGFEGYYYYRVTFRDDTSNQTYTYTLNGTAGETDLSDVLYRTDVRSLNILMNADSYSLNDTVEAKTADPLGKDNVLFVVLANGIKELKYASNISFKYTSDMIAGGKLYAVKYDPVSDYYTTVSFSLVFNTAKAALKPEVTPSSDTYKPGEKAVVNIKVPGVSGGLAVVSVVDEACFALGNQVINVSSFFESSLRENIYENSDCDQEQTPLITLDGRFSPAFTYAAGFNSYGDRMEYKQVESGGLLSSSSYCDMPAIGDRDGSAIRNTYIRQYFADNPVFSFVELDEEGCGTLAFTVPDNITSWRISVIAFDGIGKEPGELKIGSSVSDIICTQPFFINLGVCEQYVVGDTVSLSARSYGPQAKGTVNYTAVLSDTLGNEIGRTSGSADSKDRCWLKFNLDKPGRYRVTVYGECGTDRDALTADFDLVTTAVAVNISKTVTVSELKNINPVYYPVRLVFTNRTESYSLYERIIGILSCNRGSGRTDEYAALYAAAGAKGILYGENSAEEQQNLMGLITKNFDSTEGNFRTFPYSEPDPKLTASILALGLPLDTHTLRHIESLCKKAVASKDQVSPEVLIANIVSLAALGEPVLDTLYSVASRAGNYSAEAKLWLALGFALCGDYPAAYEVYSMVRAEIGSENSDYGTLSFAGPDFETTVNLTCLALMNASRIARDDGAKLATWLSENRTDAVSDRIALASYLKYFLPAETGEPLNFTYSIGETTEEIVLDSGRGFMLTLSEKEFDALKLSLPDDANVGVYYRGPIDEALLEEGTEEGRVSVFKSMNQTDTGNCTVTLDIQGTSTRISEYFDLYDLIPSGARLISLEAEGYSTKQYGTVRVSANIYNRNGQHMTGTVSVYNSIYEGDKDLYRTECPEYGFDISITYVIRGAVEGDFVAESAYVRNPRTGAFGISQRYKVKISEKLGWSFKEIAK